MHPFIKASKEYETLFSGWFKNMLGISTGALALLVSLLPTASLPSPDKYFLGVCWSLFVVCILCSLIGSLRPIILAHLTLQVNAAGLNAPPSNNPAPIKTGWLSPTKKMKAIDICQWIAIVSFCFSFVSLAIYALLRTF